MITPAVRERLPSRMTAAIIELRARSSNFVNKCCIAFYVSLEQAAITFKIGRIYLRGLAAHLTWHLHWNTRRAPGSQSVYSEGISTISTDQLASRIDVALAPSLNLSLAGFSDFGSKKVRTDEEEYDHRHHLAHQSEDSTFNGRGHACKRAPKSSIRHRNYRSLGVAESFAISSARIGIPRLHA
jgi:hypothetical protein